MRRFGGSGEFTEVMPDHFGADLDFDKGLAVVHGDALADELGEDDHVTAVRAHGAAGRPADAVEETLVLLGEAAARWCDGRGQGAAR